MKNIAILGRPNVGKSTLFNRLVGRRKSIVDSTAGVTRDISVEKIYIDGIEFNIFDTGGLLDISEDILNEKVREKALKTATEDSDILLFLVDAHQSHPDDRHFINAIRKTNKPIILVINKVDADSHNQLINEFYSLGIKEMVGISAEHNNGIEDLKYRDLDKAHDLMTFFVDNKENLPVPEDDTPLKILIGPENVNEALRDTSVVVASYDIGGGMRGLVGVVGPTRMDYATVTARLSYFADSLTRMFGKSELPPKEEKE